MNKDELKYLKEKERQKVQNTGDGIKINQSKEFKKHFNDIEDTHDRNFAIINAYLDGYTQVEIANYLHVSKSLVSKIVKSGDVTPGCNCNIKQPYSNKKLE